MVVMLFNKLTEGLALWPKSSLDIVHMEVNSYCNRTLKKIRATIVHAIYAFYLRSPLALVCFFGAIFLLLLTFIQSLYSALSYHHPKGK